MFNMNCRNYETLKEKIKSSQVEIRAKQRYLDELTDKIGQSSKEEEEVDAYRRDVYIAKEKSDTYQLIKNSSKEKEEKELRLKTAKANHEKFEECRKTLQRLFYDLKLSFNIAESLENSQTQEDKIFYLTQAEQLFAEFKEKNEKEYYDLCSWYICKSSKGSLTCIS